MVRFRLRRYMPRLQRIYIVTFVLLLVYFLSRQYVFLFPEDQNQDIRTGLWKFASREFDLEGQPDHPPGSQSWSFLRVKNPTQQDNEQSLPLKNSSWAAGSKIRNNTLDSAFVMNTKEETFQEVGNRTLFVYSAYLTPPEEVTVVAAFNHLSLTAKNISCVYYHGNGSKAGSVQGKVHIFPDDHGRVFSPAYIRCPVPEELKVNAASSSPSSLLAVSISTPLDQTNANRVRVQEPAVRQYQFLICFPPLHSGFGKVSEIVDNLEMAKLLGAQYAVVYRNKVSRKVDQVLRHYARKGFLEVKNWTNPPEPIHYKGQMAAINDCLLQNRYRADFIIFMDFDEMIVPQIHTTWASLTRTLISESSSSDFVRHNKEFVRMSDAFTSRIVNGKGHRSSSTANTSVKFPEIGALRFPSTFFFKDKDTKLTEQESRFKSMFLLNQRRTRKFWEMRSKCMINPRAVDVMGIHYVRSFRGNEVTVLVNDTVGFAHHYRCCKNWAFLPNFRDSNILRFAAEFVRRLNETYRELESEAKA
ncbi:beta-1,4-galactosyltransferase galt-1-like [Babylonia areolata]|uniref:beta-1,4-galactosyltransferase galt-1-like n=1 Tax=Babylonia areolata TaxID=304850 RepID=UPI003FD01584